MDSDRYIYINDILLNKVKTKFNMTDYQIKQYIQTSLCYSLVQDCIINEIDNIINTNLSLNHR